MLPPTPYLVFGEAEVVRRRINRKGAVNSHHDNLPDNAPPRRLVSYQRSEAPWPPPLTPFQRTAPNLRATCPPAQGSPRSSRGNAPSSRSLNAPEGRVGVDLLVLDEFHGGEAVGIENAGKLLDRGRFPVDPVGLRVPPDEDVNEARRMLGLLPHLVAQRSWLVGTHARDKLVDRGGALFKGFPSHLVACQLSDFHTGLLEVACGNGQSPC